MLEPLLKLAGTGEVDSGHPSDLLRSVGALDDECLPAAGQRHSERRQVPTVVTGVCDDTLAISPDVPLQRRAFVLIQGHPQLFDVDTVDAVESSVEFTRR